jgi:hypothetical protein
MRGWTTSSKFPRRPLLQTEGGLNETAICYTYPQLLIQKATTGPGSIFNRHGGSKFTRRKQTLGAEFGIVYLRETTQIYKPKRYEPDLSTFSGKRVDG